MQRLINDLLDLSRVTRRGQVFQKVNLIEVFKEVIAEFAYTYPDIKTQTQLNGDMSIDADWNQIHQLATQLLDNAFKFQKEGTKPAVSVTIQPDNGQCRIIVTDNGIGMKEEHLSKIFDTFVRLHHGTEYPGTGIGLSLARKIVERHEGSISVNSTFGKGSTFTVTLPISPN
jgi:signal transduction histidine kinase